MISQLATFRENTLEAFSRKKLENLHYPFIQGLWHTTSNQAVMMNSTALNQKLIAASNAVFLALALATLMLAPPVRGDETCSSPYLARIEGQEEFVYV